MPFVSAELSPLISRCRDKLLAVFFPPEEKPSLHCANRANIILCCGLLLRSALIRRLRQQTARSFLLPLKGEDFGARLSHPVLLFEEYFLMDESLKHSLYSLQNQRKASPRGEAFFTLCEQGKYHFMLWFAFAIRPHPSPSATPSPSKGKAMVRNFLILAYFF